MCCSLVTLKGGISDFELAVQPILVFTHLTRCHILQSSMSFLIGSWAVFNLPFPIFHSNFLSDGNDNNQANFIKSSFLFWKDDFIHPKVCSQKWSQAQETNPLSTRQIPLWQKFQPFGVNSQVRYESVDNWHPPISHQDHRAVPVLLPRPRPQSGSACRESWTAY